MFAKIAISLAIAALLNDGATAATPSTAAEAAKVLDLETLPLPEGAELAGPRRIAKLGYSVEQPAKEVFDFVDKQLAERGWKQLPGAQDHGEFVNADYQRNDYIVHLSVFAQQPGVARVTVTHKGNVALNDVPVPANVEKMHAFTGIVMFKSPDGVKEAASACRQRMLAAGWSPYGGAGDTAYYRQHAVQIDVNVMSAPGQGGATVISISSHLLSLEIPAPPFADDFRYSDGTSAIGFDTDKSHQDVADFYREQLAPIGWQATTDEPVTIDWKQLTIFRNAGQEMISITTHDFEGRTRVKLDHQNAGEVADDHLRALTAAGEKAKYRNKEWVAVHVEIPDGLQPTMLADWAAKIPTPNADAFAAAEAIANTLTAAGWTLDENDREPPVIRSHRLTGQDRVIHLIAINPPKLTPWVAVVGVGGVTLVPVAK